jgi:hypothetical protein
MNEVTGSQVAFSGADGSGDLCGTALQLLAKPGSFSVNHVTAMLDSQIGEE